MKSPRFISWLMFTPNEQIPHGFMNHPGYSHIGAKILELIESNIISIRGLDKDGIININIH